MTGCVMSSRVTASRLLTHTKTKRPETAFLGGTVRRISAFAMTALIILARSQAEADAVPLEERDGTFVVRAVINDALALGFTVDSASEDVSIPSELFSALISAGTISADDIIDFQSYRLADGTVHSLQRFRIRSLRVGNVEILDVIGSVVPAQGDLLLGQSFLSRIKSWSIDNERHLLLLNEPLNNEQPVTAGSTAPSPAGPTNESMSGDFLFRDTLAYLLTGDELGKIRVLDRTQCIVEVRHRIWPDTPDLVSVIHMNNVDRVRSSIEAINDVPSNRVDITLRGKGVVDYLARPSFKLGQREVPAKPAHSASEDVITLYTDEVERVRRAWDYIYSHGCRGSNGAEGRRLHR